MMKKTISVMPVHKEAFPCKDLWTPVEQNIAVIFSVKKEKKHQDQVINTMTSLLKDGNNVKNLPLSWLKNVNNVDNGCWLCYSLIQKLKLEEISHQDNNKEESIALLLLELLIHMLLKRDVVVKERDAHMPVVVWEYGVNNSLTDSILEYSSIH